eukprot:scpid69420/ scgid12555/ 
MGFCAGCVKGLYKHSVGTATGGQVHVYIRPLLSWQSSPASPRSPGCPATKTGPLKDRASLKEKKLAMQNHHNQATFFGDHTTGFLLCLSSVPCTANTHTHT